MKLYDKFFSKAFSLLKSIPLQKLQKEIQFFPQSLFEIEQQKQFSQGVPFF